MNFCVVRCFWSNFVYSKVTQHIHSLLRRGFKDFLVSSNANALDDKHFSSNAGDAMRGRGETKYRKPLAEERGTFIHRSLHIVPLFSLKMLIFLLLILSYIFVGC